MRLYANVMAFNERPFLPYMLERLQAFCDYTIIMDNGSTDGSRKWLEQCDDDVDVIFTQQTDPPHYADLRNVMLSQVPDGDWVLKWDPDELPSDALVKSVRGLLETQVGVNAWKIPLYHIFKSRNTCLPIDFETFHLRLFRKTSTTRWQGAVHEQPTIEKPCGRMNPARGRAIVHFSYFAEARLRRKALHYASISGSGFHDPTRLTDRLDLVPRALPEQVAYQASSAWLEMVRGIE